MMTMRDTREFRRDGEILSIRFLNWRGEEYRRITLNLNELNALLSDGTVEVQRRFFVYLWTHDAKNESITVSRHPVEPDAYRGPGWHYIGSFSGHEYDQIVTAFLDVDIEDFLGCDESVGAQ